MLNSRLFWLGLAFLFLGIFLKTTWELHEGESILDWDAQLLLGIAKYRNSTFTRIAVDLTALGSVTLIGIFCVFGVGALWLGNDFLGASYLAIGSSGAGLSTFLLKRLFTRDRPSMVSPLVSVSGFSYPSGHSLAATSFYLLLMFLVWRRFPIQRVRVMSMMGVTFLVGGICLSRLYLGVHYPSDVFSGVLLGSAWVCLLTSFFWNRHIQTDSGGTSMGP